MHRVLNPSGFLIVSYHGTNSQALLSVQERNSIATKGFLFKVEGLGKYKLDGLPDIYQSAYISTSYIKEHWSKYFKIENIIDEEMNAHQSVVLMRKN